MMSAIKKYFLSNHVEDGHIVSIVIGWEFICCIVSGSCVESIENSFCGKRENSGSYQCTNRAGE